MGNGDSDRMNLSRDHRAQWALRCSLFLLWMIGLGIAPSRTTSIPAESLFTPADFGYQRMTINGQPALGHRPLLVILANFAGGNPFAHSLDYYNNLVFNWLRNQSLNGYFLANSNGRFMWTRAGRGIIGPVQFEASQRCDNVKDDSRYVNQILGRVAELRLFDFKQFDSNSDHLLTPDELGLLVVSNDGDVSGAARSTGCYELPHQEGDSVYYLDDSGAVNAALVNHQTPFITIAHELCHLLGAVDIYGSNCLSQNLSLMSCTSITADDMRSCHLDPWHKMQLGWDEPRIEEITSLKCAWMPVVQMGDPHAPLILYDSNRGPSEFFMLECRTANSAKGGGYDDNVTGKGLAIWHVQQDENLKPKIIPGQCMGPILGQSNWRWCSKCQGLHYIDDWQNPVLGPCPAGKQHEIEDSSGYTVVQGVASAPGQHGWRYCQKCRGLFFGAHQTHGIVLHDQCPAGGQHDGSRSGDYSLVMDDPDAPGQPGWRWCWKCDGLFYGPNQAQSRCPAGGQHEAGSATQYSVLCDAYDNVIFAEGSPNLGRGNAVLWDNTTTPSLRWMDGTPITPSKIWVASSYAAWGIIVCFGNN